MPTDSHNQNKMRHLGHRLAQVMNASPEVREEVRRIQLEGFSLSLGLNSRREEQMALRLEILPPDPSPEPAFRLDGNDVTFLKSMRIDPTRPARRRH